MPMTDVEPTVEMPSLLHDAGLRQRSDAARHRVLILDAAAALVAETDVAAVTMDEVARRAGVGKGTVFRHFGSRAGLMLALLDRLERDLQIAALCGPTPLGPGADPVDRLLAYGGARLALVDTHGDLLRAAGAEFLGSGAYAAAHWHVRILLQQQGFGSDDAMTAHQLLAALAAPMVHHQRQHESMSMDRIAAAFESLVRRVTA